MYVDRCICFDLTLADLKQRGAPFADLQRDTGCATSCGMCESYIRRMLRTGETRIPLMQPEEANRWRLLD